MDQDIGRLINQIKKEKKWKNTLFMFASDNGASNVVVRLGYGTIGSITRWASLGKDWANVSNTPFRYYKNYSYSGGICTPFIVHWPAVITKGGKINHTPLDFIDLMPTLIDITGASYPKKYKGEEVYPMEGISMLPLFKGDSIDRKKPLYFDYRKGSAILTDHWKLVRQRPGAWELYNMKTDRTETNNLAGERPVVVKELKTKWQQWAKRVGVHE